jgi:small subunit ribosomal protein S16
VVKIRLRRIGAKKRAFYRLVVCDSRTARNGRFIESVGTYDPNLDPPAINMKKDRIEYWLGTGAQPSDTARWLLKTQGFLGGLTVKKTKETKESKKAKAAEPVAEAAPEAPAEEPVVEVSAEVVEESTEAAAEETVEA